MNNLIGRNVIYNNKQYAIENTMYGLSNIDTKEIVKVYDENEIKKFVKIVQ